MTALLSILIPCYNEGGTIRTLVERVAAQQSYVGQIIVANDGSSDQTRFILDDYKKAWTHPSIELTILHLDQNRGKGAAVRAALEKATLPYILIQDADLELNPSDYHALLQPIVSHNADVVFGNRFPEGYPSTLRWASRIANTIVTVLSNSLYDMKLDDQACGYKLLPTSLAKELKLKSDGFEICSEMTAKVGRRRSRVTSVAVHYDPRDMNQGKKIRWIDGFIAVYTLIKYRL